MLLSFPTSNTGSLAVIKTADQSVSNSAALVNDTHLTFAIGPNETWVADYVLSATFSAAGQIKAAVTGPSGSTVLAVADMIPNGILPAFGTAAGAAGIALVAALSTAGVVRVRATVVNGSTAGSVTLQFAQNTSDATATTLKQNSSVIARKI